MESPFLRRFTGGEVHWSGYGTVENFKGKRRSSAIVLKPARRRALDPGHRGEGQSAAFDGSPGAIGVLRSKMGKSFRRRRRMKSSDGREFATPSSMASGIGPRRYLARSTSQS